MTASLQHQVDVAIVGYGPVGQTLAILLAQQGYSVAVVERWPQPYGLPRAIVFDHEIARTFQALGISDQLTSIVEGNDYYEWRNADGQTLLKFHTSAIAPSGWPASVNFCQPQLEDILDHKIRTMPNLSTFRGWEAVELEESADAVTLVVRPTPGAVPVPVNGNQTETMRIRARYVVGADGANSFIRKIMDVPVHDLGFSFNWLVVDVLPNEERVWEPRAWQLCDPKRPTTIVPGGPGRRRWEFMLLSGEILAEMNNADVSWRLLEAWGMTPDNARLERHAVYTFRGSWAENWRKGRLMIAGDAAHLMPPFAGQGMCSGIRDAAALGWRLDLILRGAADDALLDSYTSERRPHVEHLVNFSVELGHVICIPDPTVAAQRDAKMIADLQGDPPPLPQPRLGGGVWLSHDRNAGTLFVQGRVAAGTQAGAKQGLFDDIVGHGFALVSTTCDPLEQLSPQNRDFWQAIGAVSAWVTPKGPVVDLDGSYAQWFESQGYTVALARPDFYLFGSCNHPGQINALVDALRLSPGFKSRFAEAA